MVRTLEEKHIILEYLDYKIKELRTQYNNEPDEDKYDIDMNRAKWLLEYIEFLRECKSEITL